MASVIRRALSQYLDEPDQVNHNAIERHEAER
jgi:hypothetical protein